MLIWFGIEERRVRLGDVAEWCPVCHDITVCRAFRIDTYPQLYMVPLWKPRTRGHAIFCTRCNRLLDRSVEDYPILAPPPATDLEALIDQTNPGLRHEVEQLRQVDEEAHTQDDSMPTGHRRRELEEPFIEIEPQVINGTGSIHLDWISGPLAFASISACLSSQILKPITSGPPWFPALRASLLPIGGTLLAITAVYFLLSRRSRIPPRCERQLLSRLGDLAPSADELEQVVDELAARGLFTAQRINRSWLQKRVDRQVARASSRNRM